MDAVEQIEQTGITMPWPLRDFAELPAFPETVPYARKRARRVLAEWALNSQADAVELVVSELITNAVVHGKPEGDCDDCHHHRADPRVGIICECPCHGRTAPGVPAVRLWLCSDGNQVFVQVWDGSEAMPVLRDAQPDSDSGRGLVLVNTISHAWGCYRPVRSTGKAVWALLPRRHP